MIQEVSQEMQDDVSIDHPDFLEAIHATLHFVESLKHQVFVVKLGGVTFLFIMFVVGRVVFPDQANGSLLMMGGHS